MSKATDLIRRIIREELRTELALFKKEIIREIRNSAVSMNDLHEMVEQQRPSKSLNSFNPLRGTTPQRKPNVLAQILEETEPHEDDGFDEMLGVLRQEQQPPQMQQEQPISTGNDLMDKLVNSNYSNTLKVMEESVAAIRQNMIQ